MILTFDTEQRQLYLSTFIPIIWFPILNTLFVFLFLQKGIGPYTYIIFIVILVASIIFIVIFVPETKNKTFDEIAQSIAFGRQSKSSAFGQDAEELQPMGDSKKV